MAVDQASACSVSADPPSDPKPANPWSQQIEHAVQTFSHAVRREARRTVVGFIAELIVAVLLLLIGAGCVVAGMVRLAGVVAVVCGRWFDNAVLGEMVAGSALVTVPIVAFLVLRRKTWW